MNTIKELQILLIHDVKLDIRDDPILPNSIQEPSTFSKYDCVLDALLKYDRELKNGIQLENDIWWLFVMSNLTLKMTKSSKIPVRNQQSPPTVTVFLMNFYSC